jgi:hypothetical protein
MGVSGEICVRETVRRESNAGQFTFKAVRSADLRSANSLASLATSS